MPYIDTFIIEQVKRIDLLTYLQEHEPDELVRIGPAVYCTKEHDSLKISNGKWFWWSRGFGGRSALDYLIKVRGMKFTDAVLHLDGSAITSAPKTRMTSRLNPPKKAALQLPPIGKGEVAVRYLKERGIDPTVIEHCLAQGSLYGSINKRHNNVVFVGRDSTGTPRYAGLRGCTGDFKGEAVGSDKRYAFRPSSNPENPEVHVFESAIDALSYATILQLQQRDWKYENLISLGGVPPISSHPGKASVPAALAQYLNDNPGTTAIRLHLDNDAAGLNASGLISALFSGKYRVSIESPIAGKDVNDYLLTRIERMSAENGQLVR